MHSNTNNIRCTVRTLPIHGRTEFAQDPQQDQNLIAVFQSTHPLPLPSTRSMHSILVCPCFSAHKCVRKAPLGYFLCRRAPGGLCIHALALPAALLSIPVDELPLMHLSLLDHGFMAAPR